MGETRFEILLLIDLDGTGPAWHPMGEVDASDVWSLELPAGARRIVVRPAPSRRAPAEAALLAREVPAPEAPSLRSPLPAGAPDEA